MDNTLIFNIALIALAFFATIYCLKQIVLFATKRPDLVALLSGIAIIVGAFMLAEGHKVNAFITITTGLTLLMMASLNYRHYNGGK